MHIPSEMFSGGICPVTAAVASAGIVSAVYMLAKEKCAPSALKFSLVSASIFGMQMLNYPIWDGVSGHLIGGVFAACILGVPAAIISLSIVLLLQTLLFADGGIAMLGANIVNMALLGAGAGGIIRAMLIKRKVTENKATALAAFFSVELAVLALCAELFVSGKGSFEIFSTLIISHTFLALIEGFATVALISLVGTEDSRAGQKRSYAVLAAMLLVALAGAPLASSFPDAFEWTMESFSMLPDAPNFVNAPFADYTVCGVDGSAQTLIAASMGMLATFALSFVAGGFFQKKGV